MSKTAEAGLQGTLLGHLPRRRGRGSIHCGPGAAAMRAASVPGEPMCVVLGRRNGCLGRVVLVRRSPLCTKIMAQLSGGVPLEARLSASVPSVGLRRVVAVPN